MNWFYDFFTMMINEKKWLYNLDFFSDILLFIAIGLCVVSILFKSMKLKQYLLAVLIGVTLFVLDKTIELPLSGISESPRIKNLTMDTILYSFAIFTGMAGVLTITFLKKKRTIESIAFSTALLVMSSLMFSYHLLIVNGGLKTAISNNESFYLKVISGDDHIFDFFCEDKELHCYSGRISSFPRHFDDLPEDLVLAYKETALKVPEPVFMLSNVATTAKIKYTSVFAQRGSKYRLIYENKKANRLFDSQKMQMMTLINAAVIFWFSMSSTVVWIHRRRFFKKRKNK